MNSSLKQQLETLFPHARFAEPLSAHCTFRIGGPADAFIEIQRLDAETTKRLTSLLKFLNQSKIPYFILGGGSNVLFHDKGFRGVVIKITSNSVTFKSNEVEADAGVNLQFLISQASKKGFQNLLQLTGIPGTIGGAVRGNAGANGIETKDVLISATVLNTKTGAIKTFTNKQLKFTYRNSHIKKNPNLLVLSAKFHLSKKTVDKTLLAKLNTRRTQTQPYGLSAGSFFKNPSQTDNTRKAGFLIEQCGLKGTRLRGVAISEKHANFFQNLNDPLNPATQKDLLALAAKVKKAVFKKFKIRLTEEVQIVPQKPKHSRKTKK